ncbi:MAG: glycosyltransferase [Christensenellaceae bacterium]|jgi:glycosyltransferase involved in cell wall biosynthesis|nr:glycosyltransferase [Christensenellaceae bacterium]
MKVSLILPIYNEQLILETVLEKYIADLQDIQERTDAKWEVIAVDDGSGDKTPAILIKFAKKYRNFKVITLDGRYGKQAAITAGFGVADGDVVMIADIDLLNPKGVLSQIYKAYQNGKNPIVHGYREFIANEKRDAVISDFFTRLATKLFWIPGRYNGKIQVALYSSDVADIIRSQPTKNKYMRTMNNWVGYEIKEVWFLSEYNRTELKEKMAELKYRQSEFAPVFVPRDKGREHTATRIYALLFMVLAIFAFVFAIVTMKHSVLAYCFAMVGLGVVLWIFSALFFLKSMLLKRVGILKYKNGETLYEIRSILNQ